MAARSPAGRPKPVEVGTLFANATSRQRKNGQGLVQWYWRARRKDDRTYAWTGWATRDEVQLVLANLLASGRSNGMHCNDQPFQVGTVGELIEQWWAYQRTRPDLAPSTIDCYHKAARHLTAWIGEVMSARVDRGTLEMYRDDRLREGAAPRTVQLELRIMLMAWRWGGERGLVPARELPRVKIRIDGYVINHRTPAPEEIAPVLDELTGDSLLVMQLLALTGARVGEICAVCLADLDPHQKFLTLDGKTGPRAFPLPDEIFATLSQHLKEHDVPLVPGSRKVAAQIVRGHLKRACKHAGVEPFTPHGFRRMVVDRMARSGVDVATAASLTGHSVEVMLRFYRQVTDEDRRAAVLHAGLGHFPTRGQVVDGPWKDTVAASRGTESGHNRGN